MESTYCGRGRCCTNVCDEFATSRKARNATTVKDECLAVLYDDENPKQQAQNICSGDNFCHQTPGQYIVIVIVSEFFQKIRRL